MFGSDVGRGRGNRIQHVVASIKAAQARARQRHRLAHAHVLVVENGSAPRQTHDVAQDRAIHRTRQHCGRVITVILLVVRRKTARDVLGSDVGHGRGNRVQHIVTDIGPGQTRACERHDLAIAHVLVGKRRCAARQTHDVPTNRAAKTARQHRGGVVAVVLFAIRHEAAGDVLGSNVRRGRGDRVQHVVASVGAGQARAR